MLRIAAACFGFAALTALAAGPFSTTPASCNKTNDIVPPLMNGWENYGVTMKTLIVSKDCMGIVRFAGGLKGGANELAFQLPPGYRPTAHEIFPAATTTYRAATVYVTPDGWVSLVGNNTYISISGITFKAAD